MYTYVGIYVHIQLVISFFKMLLKMLVILMYLNDLLKLT